MSKHSEEHPLASQTVRIKDGTVDAVQGAVVGGAEFCIEDWWDRLYGDSWTVANGNPAALQYAMRVAPNQLPLDNEVVYGKIGHFGHLVHISEIAS